MVQDLKFQKSDPAVKNGTLFQKCSCFRHNVKIVFCITTVLYVNQLSPTSVTTTVSDVFIYSTQSKALLANSTTQKMMISFSVSII